MHDRSSEVTSLGQLGAGAFYDMAAPLVHRYLVRACFGDRALAEDLTSETFTAAVVEAQRGGAAHVTVAWLLLVARRKLIDTYRRREREERKLRLAWATERVEPQPDDDGATADVMASLGSLSSAHRSVLVLRYLDGLSVPAVAEAIGRSVHATESLLARARIAARHAGGAP